jgi:hypothetical protein
MSKNKIILFIGILLVAVPLMGFPPFWNEIFYIVAGIVLIILAVHGHIKRREAFAEYREVVTEVYVENTGGDRM